VLLVVHLDFIQMRRLWNAIRALNIAQNVLTEHLAQHVRVAIIGMLTIMHAQYANPLVKLARKTVQQKWSIVLPVSPEIILMLMTTVAILHVLMDILKMEIFVQDAYLTVKIAVTHKLVLFVSTIMV
jgi:hypothetical protein